MLIILRSFLECKWYSKDIWIQMYTQVEVNSVFVRISFASQKDCCSFFTVPLQISKFESKKSNKLIMPQKSYCSARRPQIVCISCSLLEPRVLSAPI